ncbi:MAG TPA: UDP-N-acetylglucosamine 1-carboxyvinyltransferase [Terriglobales bacterium]|nr:UDP-N-acetylglucosamine 1-carboxyvinyltransferase [Terriglobales bacterium]
MDALTIRGGRRLSGRVPVSGAKNAALPLMAATLLTPGVHTLRNMPLLRDTRTMARVLQTLGARVEFHGHVCVIDTTEIRSVEAPYDLVRTMRASVYVLGPLLARLGAARVSLPGGCAWGPRPINLHLEGLDAMHADLAIEHGYVVGSNVKLRGADVHFSTISVGATAQLMMAAVLADGVTTLDNAAIEPDVTSLAEVLVQCGAEIEGIGSRRLTIRGVKTLWPIEADIIPDRIESATFLAAAAITGGRLTVEGCEPAHVGAAMRALEQAGCEVLPGPREVTISGPSRPAALNLVTEPFPGFPTDMQAQMMAVCSVADGTSTITDTIYVDRFTHVPELVRLGANIRMQGNVAIVNGVERLQGAPVMATDIRAGGALVLAALAAEGESKITRIYHLDRGYEEMDRKLVALGADVTRIREPM